RLHRTRPAVLVPFRGFGTEEVFHIRGRVLEKRAYLHEPSPQSALGQLRFMYQRFQTDEVPGIPLRASYAGVEVQTRTNEEGFFNVTLEPPGMLPADRIWHDVNLSIVAGDHDASPVSAPVVVPPIEA